MDVENIFELYGSDSWREISALYCIDGKEAYAKLSPIEKQASTIIPYAKVVDLNQSDLDAKRKPAIIAGLKISF